MEQKEFISKMNWEDLNSLLQNEPLQSETLTKLKSINTTGYDLCIEPKSFLSEIGIKSTHEQNIILRKISPYINDQLNITFNYNNKDYSLQLENDINYTIDNLVSSIKLIFNIKEELFLCPFNNNDQLSSILLPNFKIVEKIFMEPDKYTSLKKFDYKDNFYNPIKKVILEDNIYINMKKENKSEEKKIIPINKDLKNESKIKNKEMMSPIKNDIKYEDDKKSLIKRKYSNKVNEEIKKPYNNILDDYYPSQKTIKLKNDSFSNIMRNTKKKDDFREFTNYNYDDTLDKTEKIFNKFNNENINNISQNNISHNNINQNNIEQNKIIQNNINQNNLNQNNISPNHLNQNNISPNDKNQNNINQNNILDPTKKFNIDDENYNKLGISIFENDKSIDISNLTISNNPILNKDKNILINSKSVSNYQNLFSKSNLNEPYKYSKKSTQQNSLNSSNIIKDIEVQREKDREELNTYIKKGYGIYPLEGTKLFSISTDRRNYRTTKTPDNKIEKSKANTKRESNEKDDLNNKVSSITIKLNHTPERKNKEKNETISTTELNDNHTYVYKSKYLNEIMIKHSEKENKDE